jgi:hypothetical protein
MTETEADQLRETVERMHGGTATLAQSVPVLEPNLDSLMP